MINLLNHLTINSHNDLASKGPRWHQAYKPLFNHTTKRSSLFKNRSLLCWRSDLVFLNLRACFLSMLKAMHLIWVAVKNNNRVIFINHAGPLDNIAHCSSIDQLIKNQLQRTQLPRLKRSSFRRQGKSEWVLVAQKHKGFNTARSKQKRLLYGKASKTDSLRGPLGPNVEFNRKITPFGAEALLGAQPVATPKKIDSRLSHIPTKSVKNSKLFKKIKNSRRLNGHPLALGLNRLLSICSDQFKKAGINRTDAQTKSCAILGRNDHLLQTKAAQLSSRLNVGAYGGAAMGWFSNSDPTFRRMFNHLTDRQLGLSHIFSNNSNVISTNDEPSMERPRRYTNWTTRLTWLSAALTNRAKFKKTSSGPVIAGKPPAFLAKSNTSDYQRFSADVKRAGRQRLPSNSITKENISAEKSLGSFVHHKLWRHQMFAYKAAYRPRKRFKSEPFRMSWLCPNQYNQTLFDNAALDYNRFVKNPFISQSGVVIFSHPEKAINMVNQVKHLGIPTVGFISGNADPTQKAHTSVDFPIVGNPENYHLHNLVLRYFINLAKRASGSPLKSNIGLNKKALPKRQTA